MPTGHTCKLANVEQHHYQFLYDLATIGRGAIRWRFHGAQVPQRDFLDILNRDVLAHYVIETLQNVPLGYVVAYNADVRNGYVFIGVTIAESALGAGVGGEGGLLFIQHVFQAYPFRKIYVEIPEFTVGSVESRMEGLFVREGVLAKHFFADGRYWDQHIFATYREQWEGRVESLLDRRRGTNLLLLDPK